MCSTGSWIDIFQQDLCQKHHFRMTLHFPQLGAPNPTIGRAPKCGIGGAQLWEMRRHLKMMLLTKILLNKRSQRWGHRFKTSQAAIFCKNLALFSPIKAARAWRVTNMPPQEGRHPGLVDPAVYSVPVCSRDNGIRQTSQLGLGQRWAIFIAIYRQTSISAVLGYIVGVVLVCGIFWGGILLSNIVVVKYCWHFVVKYCCG